VNSSLNSKQELNLDKNNKVKPSIKSFLLVTALIVISIFASLTKCTYITYLPAELLVDNPINPSQALENFLNSCSNKKVVFPLNKTFVLERQLAIHNVENLEIDFNGCTIQLPDECNWDVRYDTGEYVPISAITIHSSINIKFSNYIIDGCFWQV